MNKFPRTLLVIILSVFVSWIFVASVEYSGGAPEGFTGSPGDGHDCSVCHSHMGTPVTDSGMITSDIPPQGYTPGETYTIHVAIADTGVKGFEASPQKSDGTLAGTLYAGQDNHLTTSGKYVTQDSPSSDSITTWTFTWKAPPAGSGHVTFYAATTGGTHNTKLGSLVVAENVTSGMNEPMPLTMSIYPSVVHERVNLSFTILKEETVFIRLMDNRGREISTLLQKTPFDAGNHVLSFYSLPEMAAGMYFIILTTENSVVVRKIIRE
jgi:hypothetical protein